MLRETAAIVNGIRDSIAPEDALATAGSMPPVSEAALDRLEFLVASSDYDAVTQFRELATALHHQFGAPIEAISSRLRAFDYEQALVLLKNLRVRGVETPNP